MIAFKFFISLVVLLLWTISMSRTESYMQLAFEKFYNYFVSSLIGEGQIVVDKEMFQIYAKNVDSFIEAQKARYPNGLGRMSSNSFHKFLDNIRSGESGEKSFQVPIDFKASGLIKSADGITYKRLSDRSLLWIKTTFHFELHQSWFEQIANAIFGIKKLDLLDELFADQLNNYLEAWPQTDWQFKLIK